MHQRHTALAEVSMRKWWVQLNNLPHRSPEYTLCSSVGIGGEYVMNIVYGMGCLSTSF